MLYFIVQYGKNNVHTEARVILEKIPTGLKSIFPCSFHRISIYSCRNQWETNAVAVICFCQFERTTISVIEQIPAIHISMPPDRPYCMNDILGPEIEARRNDSRTRVAMADFIASLLELMISRCLKNRAAYTCTSHQIAIGCIDYSVDIQVNNTLLLNRNATHGMCSFLRERSRYLSNGTSLCPIGPGFLLFEAVLIML